MAAPRMRRRRPMRVERQTLRRQLGRSAVLPAARRFSVLGLSVCDLSVLGLAVLGLSVTGLAAPARAAQGPSSLGGPIVSPAPAFPIRAAGRPPTQASLKSRSPHAAYAASQQRLPQTRSPATFPKSAIFTAAGALTSGSLGARPTAPVRSAVVGATRTTLRRASALRPKVRH